MQEIAWINGRLVPASELNVSVTDWGFVQGVTLGEQLRTFAGVPFQVSAHLERLQSGLRIVGWPEIAAGDLEQAMVQVAMNNYQRIDPRADLGVCVFVTPGIYPGYGSESTSGAAIKSTVRVHTYRLAFHLWHAKYTQGVTVVTVDTRQVPTDCWPANLKCRSRMHYYLAAQEANLKHPTATALLLDHDGFVSDTPTANIVACFGASHLVSPPREKILPGVSLNYMAELARKMGIQIEFRDLLPAELAEADEIFLASTPFCLLPVLRFNERTLPGPGPLFRQLLSAWSEAVDVDISAQAARAARP